VDPPGDRDKAGNRTDSHVGRRFQLNDPVTGPAPTSSTSYRLAPALGVRLVGRSLVTLAVLVAIMTVIGAATGAGWRLAGVTAVIGIVLVAAGAWYLFRLASAVRLTSRGYAVHLLGGVGTTAAPWGEVEEVVAATPAGRPCLVLGLRDGSATRLPMAALAGDPDAFAHDVRRRVRDAHTPTGPTGPGVPEDGTTGSA
jgi:hypothetical protein